MKTCPNCNSDYNADIAFCPKCGTPLIDKAEENGNADNKRKKPSRSLLFRRFFTWILIVLCAIVFIIYRYYNSTSYMILEPDSVSFPIAGDKSVLVDINYDGHSYSIEHVPSWIKAEEEDNNFSLTAEPNNTGEDREATVVIKSGHIKMALPVSQKGKATYLIVNPQTLTFGRDSEYERVDVDCDGLTFKVDSAPSWVDISAFSDHLNVSVSENTTNSNKDGYIVLSSGLLTTRIRVTQGGGATYLRFEPTSLRLPKGAGSLGYTWDVNLDYDGYDYDVTYHSEWLNVMDIDNCLTISADDNTTGANRDGSITVKSGDVSRTLSVTQLGKTTKLEIDPKLSRISDDHYGGASFSFHVNSDGTGWKVDYPSDLRFETISDGFKVTFPKNDKEYRSGTLKIYEDNITKTITVVQGGLCSSCHGKGYTNCATCGGNGGWNTGYGWSNCFVCKGARTIKCSTCKGTKYREP